DGPEDDHDVFEPGSRLVVHLVRFVGQHVTDQAAAGAGDGGPHGCDPARAVRVGEVSSGCPERTARTMTPSAARGGPFGPCDASIMPTWPRPRAELSRARGCTVPRSAPSA